VGRSRSVPKAHAVMGLLGAVLAASAGAIAWVAGVTWLLDPRLTGPFGWHQVMLAAQSTFAYAVLLAGLLMAASTAVHLSDQARARALAQARAEAALARERLEMLTLHLHPHFLFNTLNTIVGLVPAQPAQAVDVVHRLSTLLRAALAHAGSTLAPLEQELALAEQFLAIARVRWGPRLRIDVQVPAELLAVRVPLLLLQPLLENAIKHGVERRSGPGHIVLAVRARAQGIELRVEDDGVGLSVAPSPRGANSFSGVSGVIGTGVGLHTTRQRLAMLYGERASLALLPRPEGGACAVIHLPTD
jgi:LytS/YehU family sensor histidine kinase